MLVAFKTPLAAALALAFTAPAFHAAALPLQPPAATAPCDSLELGSPRGAVLASAPLVLRWRTAEGGPFEVRVLDPEGRPVYAASTYGHELRVLVSRGEDAMRGPAAEQLRSGRAYRWTVRPVNAADVQCPAAEFRVLSPEESAEAQARFEETARRLGVGSDAAEPAAGLAMAAAYAAEEHYVLAERELERLIDEGWDDPAIDRALADLYRKTGRRLSLAAMPGAVPP